MLLWICCQYLFCFSLFLSACLETGSLEWVNFASVHLSILLLPTWANVWQMCTVQVMSTLLCEIVLLNMNSWNFKWHLDRWSFKSHSLCIVNQVCVTLITNRSCSAGSFPLSSAAGSQLSFWLTSHVIWVPHTVTQVCCSLVFFVFWTEGTGLMFRAHWVVKIQVMPLKIVCWKSKRKP